MKNQKGQVVLILILVMTVALGIGVSVVQRSLSDVSTATRTEQSARALSAAEAGIEKALSGNNTGVTFDNQATFNVSNSGSLPCVPGSEGCAQTEGQQQEAFEYPPLSKEEIAHVWLADPDSLKEFYNPPDKTLDVFWGNPEGEKTALELTLIYQDGNSYNYKKWNLEQDADRAPNNNFKDVSALCNGDNQAGNNFYQCKYQLTGLPSKVMLLRARLLYNKTPKPFAVQATGICKSCSLPPQAKSITSTGISGDAKRTVQLFQEDKVVPFFFDYAIFSIGRISK